MRWLDIFRISLRMLRSNWLRSLLTILGIGVAIGLLVLLIGLGHGLQNITVGSIVASQSLLSLDVTSIDRDQTPLKQSDVEVIKSVSGIEEASPVIKTDGTVKIEGKLASVIIVAGYPNFLAMEGVELKEGIVYAEKSNDIIVSPKVLELLDIERATILNRSGQLSFTDPANPNQLKTADGVIVRAITATNDSAIIYTPYSLLDPEGTSSPTLIKAVAKTRESLVIARDELLKKGFVVETLLELLDQAQTIFRWVTIGLAVFGIIALVVAAIGMFNTLTISLLERTREIGIMKSIGITDNEVKKLFLAESAILGFLGGLTGIGIGLTMDALINRVFNAIATRYNGLGVDLFQYPATFLLSMLIYPIILALVTGIYPSLRASRLNPLKALRYE